ncbi:SPFH domain-containing protein [Peloplasma aerotolerans]|jgi:regulator of protease activity HflC (stomatin/prohibitin superfamily)|uniref:SPFH domain-containing protein n=1 Tax=Peloplasma aerotolerans TaxID=3044389 RepID=A0AAW6U555_9MOLU|nr:SPFH domain-containing protein [Mariniplasma sp. M4Ah]MDI6452050.1 SPFH domain-containing protein [Mariniplasma sp. M4Ah]MDR4968223.1 SPFH domain-containing protein [Acholeplasmataceae bacterium]
MEFLNLFINPIALNALETALIIVAIVLFVILAASFRLVTQTKKVIVERLGGYHTTWGVGIHFLIPVVDRMVKTVSLKEQVKDFDPQPVITKDNVTMQIDTVVFFSITDPKAYTYGTEDPMSAIENISATTLRNIIGDLDLDQTLTSRDLINTKMREILDEATDPWGIRVSRVEVKNIVPPKDIRDSMEKQMRAEREKRQNILIAEGEKRSQILKAEGEAEAVILRAEADKKQRILKAEGEAAAIFKIKEAEALGIKLIKDAGADQAVLTLKSLEALAQVANGQATKIVVPTNITDIAATVMMAAEIAKGDKK